MTTNVGPDRAVQQAIARGLAALDELGIDRQAFCLVGARSAVLSRDADPFRWRLDFKSASTIPDSRGGIVGKGGALSLDVDLETGEVTKLPDGE